MHRLIARWRRCGGTVANLRTCLFDYELQLHNRKVSQARTAPAPDLASMARRLGVKPNQLRVVETPKGGGR